MNKKERKKLTDCWPRRSPGIGDWGAKFLQFEKLEKWTERHVDNFLVMLNLLVLPFEWNTSSEAHFSQLVSPPSLINDLVDDQRAPIFSFLSRTLDLEWMMVNDPDTKASSVTRKPKITEEDYITLLEQLPFTEFCHFIGNHIRSSGNTQALLTLFSLASQVLRILGAALPTFSTTEYQSFLKRYFNLRVSSPFRLMN